MRWKLALTVTVLTVVAASGCESGESEADAEAALQQARADSVAMADSLYDAAVFDTLTWESDEARLERGAVVWRSSCEKCHGANGGGNGEAALEFQLQVPSFMVTGWQYEGDVQALRHRVFVGYAGPQAYRMPSWGVYVTYRDIDAVAHYIAANMGPATAVEQ